MTTPVLKHSDLTPEPGNADSAAAPVWAAYAEGVRFLALRGLGSSDAADEAAQETVYRAILASDAWRGATIRDPAAFIHGIARHVIADAQRLGSRTISIDMVAPMGTAEDDALSVIISGEERARVRRALGRLSCGEREVLTLSYVRGMTCPEIASRLGATAERIRKRKSRAVQRLRAAFLGESIMRPA